MNAAELKNNIILRILSINDEGFLSYLNNLLEKDGNSDDYKLNAFEQKIIKESLSDYQKGNTISNDDVFSRNKEWLGK